MAVKIQSFQHVRYNVYNLTLYLFVLTAFSTNAVSRYART
jgi:hypothetical protein